MMVYWSLEASQFVSFVNVGSRFYTKMSNIRLQSTILHFAVANNVEKDVVDLFLKVYPVLAELKDENGDLALHIAVRSTISPMVIYSLLQANPSSGSIPDRSNRLPIQMYMQQFALREVALVGIVLFTLLFCFLL